MQSVENISVRSKNEIVFFRGMNDLFSQRDPKARPAVTKYQVRKYQVSVPKKSRQIDDERAAIFNP
jgi:hypothetical protein